MLFASLLIAAGFSLLGVGPASALTPPEPEKAELLYSNGGRILSIKADGSDRQVLASRFDKVENTPFGYTEPAVSPDGSKIAFADRRSGDLGLEDWSFGGETLDYVADIRVMNADGTGSTRILSGNSNNRYSAPSWSPDGERLIAAYNWTRGKSQTGGIISFRPDGSDRKIIFRLKSGFYRKQSSRFWSPSPAVSRPSFSPDGKKILFVWLSDLHYTLDGRLEVLDLASSRRKVIGRDSTGGSWSPDGSRVVHNGGGRGGLEITKADGSGSRPLLALDGLEVDPEWSPDGLRIVFVSDRNMPENSSAREIYSVRRDGSCLTWLTNGTPASSAPTWSGKAGVSTDSGGCGAQGRSALLEIAAPRRTSGRAATLWMGENFRGRLYSGAAGLSSGGPLSLLEYRDCAFYDPERCGSGFDTLEFSMCALRNLGEMAGTRLNKARGVPFYTSRGDGATQFGVFSGTSLFVVLRDSRERMSNRQVLGGMRPFGAGPFSRNLPSPRYPRGAIRLMKRVERVQRRTRSVARTAKVVGIRKKSVRQNLRLRKTLRKFGPIRTANCGPRAKTGPVVSSRSTAAPRNHAPLADLFSRKIGR